MLWEAIKKLECDRRSFVARGSCHLSNVWAQTGGESLLAEIHGKISSDGSNLSERLEDQLTANVFGTSRYLPFHKGIKPILSKAVFFLKLIKRCS